MDLWEIPDDPDAPILPYVFGRTLQIERHVPPPPFNTFSKAKKPRKLLLESYLCTLRQSELVVDNPPMETPPPANPATAQLVIGAPIAGASARNAAIVACTVYPQTDSGASQPFQAVAKIYDALYYMFCWELNTHSPRDVTYEADSDYSVEAAAYERLLRFGQAGSFAPEYFGSWTSCLPITINGKPRTRSVRLILMERLEGTTILNACQEKYVDEDWVENAFHYPEEYRLEVLARVLDGYVRQLQTGLDQQDVAARNIMLIPDPAPFAQLQSIETSDGVRLVLPRVMLIDYDNSRIKKTHRKNSSSNSSLPENPISRFRNFDFSSAFGGWVPETWYEGYEYQTRWLVQRFYGDSQRQRYLPLSKHVLEKLVERGIVTTIGSAAEK